MLTAAQLYLTYEYQRRYGLAFEAARRLALEQAGVYERRKFLQDTDPVGHLTESYQLERSNHDDTQEECY